MRKVWCGFVAAAALAVWGCNGHSGPLETAAPATNVNAMPDAEAWRPEYYTARVRPVFQANCARCHGGMNRKGGFNFSTRSSMMRGGRTGAVIKPGDPDASLMVKLVRRQVEPGKKPGAMPPDERLAEVDAQTVETWIRAGAAMPEAAAVK